MAKQTETTNNILVIDDNHGLRQGCRRALERHGYRVDLATTGQEGLSKVLADDFDVILLDVVMPDIGGIELMRHIRAHRPNAICIVVTGYASVELAVQAMKLGAYDFLAKPFSDDNLLRAVEHALDKRLMQQEAGRTQPAEDVTGLLARQKVMPDELEEARSAYMRKVAHELRAPIAAIRSFLTVILQGYATPEKTREWQQRAAERSDDLLRLVDDLLNLARLSDPKATSAPEMVSVEEILKDVLALHAPEAEEKGIRLRVEPQRCGMILADPLHIKQLWTNLLSNAIKYTPPGGQVTVRLFLERGTIVGVVKDTGIGIAEEDLPHLFEEFYRTEQAKALTQHGTGLGLSIVKQIVQQYGGRVTVESELGRGTQFTFRLPVDSGPRS
jgi:two-component system sensor histidine kinase/response regulator